MTSFKEFNLTKPLNRALEDIGFTEATPIQAKAYPVVLSGRDAVGIAQTGTGKTFAYLLPLLRQLTFSDQRHPRILILVPTRELVEQMVSEIKVLTKYMSVRVTGIYGASNINTQKQKVYDGQDIVVATPGRLIDLLISRSIQVSAIKKLVIDEVDEMLGLGFRPQLMQILERLPAQRQNLLFSATLSEEVEELINKYFVGTQYIETISRGTPLEKIVQEAYEVPNFHTKINLLRYLFEHEKKLSKVLLFVKNKGQADLVYDLLSESVPESGVIHSNKTQPHRFEMVKNFEHGNMRLLIATDVIARGVDLTTVTHVINFDIPKDPATYLHRIGRTGRAERAGQAISLITPGDVPKLEMVQELMDKEIPLLDLPDQVEISDNLIPDEIPVPKVKIKKGKALTTPTGAFHEKKAKNKKVQLGGKRRQEKQRRALVKSRSKRNR